MKAHPFNPPVPVDAWLDGNTPTKGGDGHQARRRSRDFIVTVQRPDVAWDWLRLYRVGAVQRIMVRAFDEASARAKIAWHYFESKVVTIEECR